MRKSVPMVSNQARHKAGFAITDKGELLEFLDLGSRGIVQCSENKGVDQLRCWSASLFSPMKKGFSFHDSAHLILRMIILFYVPVITHNVSNLDNV